MTTTAADALAMLAPDTPEQWPAGILAAADAASQEASRVSLGGSLRMFPEPADNEWWVNFLLAAVRRWRGTVRRHGLASDLETCTWCEHEAYPCTDLAEVAGEARAYLGGSS